MSCSNKHLSENALLLLIIKITGVVYNQINLIDNNLEFQ